jgi:hypothetical protein
MPNNQPIIGGAEDLRVRSVITTVLLIMIVVMIVRDVFARRRNRLRGGTRGDIPAAVR